MSEVPGTDAMRVAVVIPTFNRPELLADALASVAAQTYPGARIEAVVVDNASRPPVRAEHLCAPGIDLRLIALPAAGSLAAVRQLGVAAAARGADLVVHLDDDDRLDAGALERAAGAFGRCPDLEVLFLGARGFGTYADHFDAAHRAGTERVVAASGARRGDPSVLDPARLFEALLHGVPMHFQRVAVRPAAWDRVNALREAAHGITPLGDGDRAAYLPGPWRDSEWALYAALVCRTALAGGALYLQRCERQGTVSQIARQEEHARADLRIKTTLWAASRRVAALAPHRDAIRASLERAHFNRAYRLFRQGSRGGAWRALTQATRVHPQLRQLRFALRTLLPRPS